MIFFLKHSKKFAFLFGTWFLLAGSLKAQSFLFPPDYLFDTDRQRTVMADTNVMIHTSLQPFIYKSADPDTFTKFPPGTDPFTDKLFYENLVELRHIYKSSGTNRKFNININPLFNIGQGKDFTDSTNSKVRNNTRGFWVRGELGKKLLFETAFIENQSFFPLYLNQVIGATGVVPGQGRYKVFKVNGYDYASSYGVLHYQVSNCFSIRIGHGKQKIGN